MAPAESQTDIAALWDQALDAYTEVSKVDIRTILSSQRSIAIILMDQQHQLDSFTRFRHDKTAVDRLRHVIASNADHIQQAAGLVANAASAAFPPSSAILTAFTYVLNASKNVSKDYDLIEKFFDIMQSFLQRLSLLEGRIPQQEVFQQHVIKVFSSLLTLCALARSYCVQGRFMKWAKALVDGEDPALQSALASLNENLQRLEWVTITQTLRTAIESKEGINVINQAVQSIQTQNSIIEVSLDKNTTITQQTYEISEQTLSVTTDVGSRMQEVAVGNREILRTVNELALKSDGKLSRDLTSKPIKPTNFDRLKRYLGNPAEGGMTDRLRDLELANVGRIFDWIENEPAFIDIIDEKERFLWVAGGSGMGKSSLAFRMFQILEEKFVYEPSAIVACFFFDEEHSEIRSLLSMFNWCSLVAAKRDKRYCDQILADMRSRNFETLNEDESWESLLESKFARDSDRRLVLILDGIDESEDRGISKLVGYFDRIKVQNCRIQVIMTSDPDVEADLSSIATKQLKLVKERIARDLFRFSLFQTRTLTRLRKLRSSFRKTIAQRVSRKADCKISSQVRMVDSWINVSLAFLYVTHTMRRLDGMSSEGPIRKELENLPPSTTALYEVLLSDCQNNRSPQQREVLRSLLAWLSYSRSKLTIGEANKLVEVIQESNSISIENELAGLVQVSGSSEISIQEDDTSGSEADNAEESDSEELLWSQEYGNNLISFQERSLRDYFLKEVDSLCGLRCSTAEANARIFQTMSNILATPRTDQSNARLALVDRSATWSFRHLLDIEVEVLDDNLTSGVLEGLFDLLSNKNTALRELEMDGSRISTILTVGETDPSKVLDALQRWAKRGLQLPTNSLPREVLDWLRPLSQEPSRVYIIIARGHINNWFSSKTLAQAYLGFRCAHYALEECRHLPELQQIQELRQYFDDWEQRGKRLAMNSFEVISDAFEDIVKSPSALMNIGTAMKALDLFEMAVKELDIGLNDERLNSKERFYLLLNKGDALLELGKAAEDKEVKSQYLMDALGTLDGAIETYRDITRAGDTDEALPDNALQLFQAHALSAALLGKFDLVLESIKAANNLQLRLDVDILCLIITAIAGLNEPAKVIEVLKTISKRDLIYFFATSNLDHDMVQEAAMRIGEGRYLLQQYDIIITALATHPHGMSIKGELQLRAASFARDALCDPNIAKTLLLGIINNCESLSTQVMTASYMLSDVLLESFRLLHDPLAMQVTVAEAKKLLATMIAVRNDDTFEVAKYSQYISLALMVRRVGPAIEFADMMHALFHGCLDDLRDDTGFNDLEAFRRLSRVLSCVEGFGNEASVALTAQLYVMDDEVHQMDLAKQRPPGDEDPSFACNMCRKVTKDWSDGGAYRCVYCFDCDICEECFAKKEARERGEMDPDWRVVCPRGHRYVKAPVDGWIGVKQGKLCIGEEEILFKTWLTDLENKWAQYWDRFWSNDGAL